MKTFKMLLPGMAILMMVNCAFAQTWTQTSAPSNYWTSAASSADGVKLAAAAGGGFFGLGSIYVSTNSGVNWMQTSAPTDSWTGVASSADGTKLVAVADNDLIYTSTNSGLAWAATSAPSNSWAAVASSADGSKLIAAANGDLIYFSTNSGADWTPANAPAAGWNDESVACSADGTKAIAANGNQVWISKNSGATWAQTDLPSQNWFSVCSSADGNKLVAVGSTITSPSGAYTFGDVAISTNSGVSWTTNDNFGAYGIVSSADGNRLIAQNDDGIYISTDLGMTWRMTWIQETNFIGFIACSADGNKLVVATIGFTTGFAQVAIPGPIYTLFSTPTPSMNITLTNGNFKLSWIIPSTNFVMQQSSNLTSWSNVTNTPVLNLTNLQNELVLSPSNSSGFYRLKTP